MTSNNGKSVSLSADFHLDVEKAYFSVRCGGKTFEFGEFQPAARMYKTLSNYIENGDDISILLSNMAKGARLFGYSVKGVA